TSPFELLYGYPPPFHLPYLPGDLDVASIEYISLLREFKVQLAKFHLTRAQQRIQSQANAHRSDRHFQAGDWVYVKLRRYRQSSLSTFPYHKLTSRYFGPYPIVEKIGVVAYKLLLPPEVLIHPTFHISQRKFCHEISAEIVHPPLVNLASHVCLTPEQVFERRLTRK
ncbi:hypothetical protein A4A49_58896, partial [Nicotiana attenuata]